MWRRTTADGGGAWRGVVAAVLLVAGLGACGGAEQASPDTGPSPRAGATHTARGDENQPRRADDGYEFAVTTFDGETFRLSDHRGAPVVINFWESW